MKHKRPKSKNKHVLVKYRKLGREHAYGLAWSDDVIEVDPRLTPEETLGTLLHEATHLAFPEASEKAVLKAEKILFDVIWNQKYRKIT